MKTTENKDLSNCCNAIVGAIGGVTKYYKCFKCLKPCDVSVKILGVSIEDIPCGSIVEIQTGKKTVVKLLNSKIQPTIEQLIEEAEGLCNKNGILCIEVGRNKYVISCYQMQTVREKTIREALNNFLKNNS